MQSIAKPIEATVAGLFNDRASADKAVAELRTNGFANDVIDEFGSERTQSSSDSGGLMGALGRFFGAEPSTETTSTSTGMTHIHDRLTALGLDADDAREFQSRIDMGGTLVMLHAGKRGADAIEILKRNGATPAQIEAQSAPSVKVSTPPVTTMPILDSTPKPVNDQGTQRLQLLKEVLRVNKERVQYDEVQLRKEVVSEQQTLEVPVTREEIVIERHPVAEDKTATGTIGEGETIRIPLNEERVSVEKRNVVSEEVTIGTREVQENRKIDETVRREELRTDKQGGDQTKPPMM
jgi:uncharacterized protein (TIGR02271 family)